MSEIDLKARERALHSSPRKAPSTSLEGFVVESKRSVGYPSDNFLVFIDGELAIGGWVEVDIDLADIEMGDE